MKANLRLTNRKKQITVTQYLHVGIFQGATNSILKLDLSFLNLKIYNVNSQVFKDLIKSILPTTKKDEAFLKQVKHYIRWHIKGLAKQRANTFAILPIDLTKPVDEINLYRIQNYINLISPSQFRAVEMMTYAKNQRNNKYALRLSFQFADYNSYNPVLNLDGVDLSKVVEFIKLCISKIHTDKFFATGTLSYFNSFMQNEIVMAFLNNITALEAFSKSESEITYQVSRMCAVLNSDTKEEGQIIFKNMKKFYALRSRIVHGGEYDYHLVEHYFIPLENLVSQTLSQLVLMKQDSELSDLLGQSGYGERSTFVYESKLRPFNIEIRANITTPIGNTTHKILPIKDKRN